MHSDDVFVFKLFKFIRRNFYSIDFGDAIFRNALLFQDLQPQSTERERERKTFNGTRFAVRTSWYFGSRAIQCVQGLEHFEFQGSQDRVSASKRFRIAMLIEAAMFVLQCLCWSCRHWSYTHGEKDQRFYLTHWCFPVNSGRPFLKILYQRFTKEILSPKIHQRFYRKKIFSVAKEPRLER